ncbi:FAD-dependent monooxygenase [Roseinatronobacter bogoriensis]|uniref:Monooxygenase n=1 Tax=Roseinatronobacter bogoriensis subsp. barguzinensis TaxID=441209 RepID=A0A2K8KJ97_9RHOB|nr:MULTISPECIES: FAD-dependent monooxygenase [Rhodobaca]ATX66290.1 monooxygenase [Rhodobaca barguzinensis]MBB4207415.1 salicylate hydroxylase [Rhodobaca bogoriensis DSM 18756]
MKLTGLEVLVIGGGVAGLAVSAALKQQGASVLVLEQAGGFLEVGAGLQISPNGARVIQALGQGASLEEHALRSEAVVLRAAHDGKQVLRLNLPKAGAEYHLIHRADLISVLQGACDGIETRFVAQATSVDAQGTRPQVSLSTGEVISADLVIGADGLHSVMRPHLQDDPATQPFFTGQVAWRALVPCSEEHPALAEVFMGPGRHLVSYPLRGGRLRNIVAVEERKTWAQEGWNHPDDPQHLKQAFSGFGGPVPAWLEQVEKLWLWGLFRHNVAAKWHRGNCAILGDAAHPTLPFMAQGANMALEDAYVLARELARARSISDGLVAYQAARRDRVVRVVEAANRNARNYHLRPPLAQFAHFALRLSGRIVPDAPLRQFAWIYDHDVTEA